MNADEPTDDGQVLGLQALFDATAERPSPQQLRRLVTASVRIAETQPGLSWWRRLNRGLKAHRKLALAVGLVGACAAALATWLARDIPSLDGDTAAVTDDDADGWVDRQLDQDEPTAEALSSYAGEAAGFDLEPDLAPLGNPLAVLDLVPVGSHPLVALDLFDAPSPDVDTAAWEQLHDAVLLEIDDAEL